MGKLMCFGSACIDYYVNLNGGTDYAGGGPVNMAVAASECGAEAAFIGAVGTDERGRQILAQLRKHHVDTSHTTVVDGKTAFCEVELAGSERLLGEYEEGVLKDFELSEEDLAFMTQGDICVMDLWGNQEKIFPMLESKGVKTAFDCADRPSDPVSQAVLPYADYVFFSASEDSESLRKQMKEIFENGSSVVTATLGEKGSITYDRDGFHFCPAAEAYHVMDTLGAGDRYIGVFLAHVLKGETVEECMTKASEAAAEVLSFHGAFRQED